MDNKSISLIVVLAFSIPMSGCEYDLEVHQQPEMMCTGDTLMVTANASRKASKIRVYNRPGDLIYSDSNTRHVELTVPDIQASDLQFKVVAKKKRKLWFDTKVTKETEFKLFDNQAWYDNGGLIPTYMDVMPESNATLIRATRGDDVCMEWDIENDECTHQESAQLSVECYQVSEYYFTYRGVNWRLQEGVNHSSHIKVSKVKNTTDRPITIDMLASGAQDATLQPQRTYGFSPAVYPDMVDVIYSIPEAEQEKRLCKKVTRRINCPSEGYTLIAKDFPDVEECFDIPRIDMELFCEQAP